MTGGDLLLLPPLFPGTLERELNIAPFDTSKWTSARVSDVGLCSLELGWRRTGTVPRQLGLPNGGFAGLLTRAVDGAFTGIAELRGASRVGDASVQPIFRSERVRGRLVPRDTTRFTATYFADEFLAQAFGFQQQCNDVTITVEFEFGLRRLDQVLISNAPQCLSPGGPGGVLIRQAGPSYDHAAVVSNVSIDMSQACVWEGPFEEAAATQIRGLLPSLFTQVIRDAGLIDPRSFGIPQAEIRACSCDSECNDFAPNGAALDLASVPRSRCHFQGSPQPGGGECWAQLEFDRVEFTPQGLEVVISEDESDVQQGVLEALFARSGGDFVRNLVCGPDRLWIRPNVDLSVPANVVRPLNFPISVAPAPAP